MADSLGTKHKYHPMAIVLAFIMRMAFITRAGPQGLTTPKMAETLGQRFQL